MPLFHALKINFNGLVAILKAAVTHNTLAIRGWTTCISGKNVCSRAFGFGVDLR